MRREDLLKNIAPCSLMCYTCTAFCDGVISEHAKELMKYLDGQKEFFDKNIPSASENYSQFENYLQGYCNGSCGGCRSGEHNECTIGGCFLLKCTEEHKAGFCGECPEFPCTKVDGVFEEIVYKQWLSGNQYIKDNGIEAFWEKNSRQPHLQAYKDIKD